MLDNSITRRVHFTLLNSLFGVKQRQPKRNIRMNAIRFKTILAACAFAACLSVSHSSEAQCLKGDVNLDGTINMADVLPFRDILANEGYLCEADNGDGQIDFMDAAGVRQSILDQQGAAFTDTVADGIGDFFWSTLNLNEGAVNGPIDLNMSPGESVNLYLYYSTNGPLNTDINIGYSLNVATSQNGVIFFTEAETFNHSMAFLGGTRWFYPEADLDGELGVGVAPAQSVESDLIVGMTAIGTLGGGFGLTDASALLDTGYDSNAQAFLCGSIQIDAVGSGTIELAAGPNALGIANDYNLLQSTFARASITIEPPVPLHLLGDVNRDGVHDFLDIAPFIAVLASGEYQIEADTDQNGVVNFLDIHQFIMFFPGA